jgi:hypothetical protein
MKLERKMIMMRGHRWLGRGDDMVELMCMNSKWSFYFLCSRLSGQPW